jgi:hypothetical protein
MLMDEELNEFYLCPNMRHKVCHPSTPASSPPYQTFYSTTAMRDIHAGQQWAGRQKEQRFYKYIQKRRNIYIQVIKGNRSSQKRI